MSDPANVIVVQDAFRERFGRSPDVVVRAPGRVNLLGAHVDYSDGWVTPAAIDRTVVLAAGRAAEPRLLARALSFDEDATVAYDALDPRDHWIDLPAGVAWALAEAGHPLTGLDAVFASDVPIGAGVSSSAAVGMAFVMAWETLGRFELQGVERALLGRRAENHLGVQSGIMDQYASVHGKADHLVYLDCRSLTHELVPLPAGTRVVVADSGVRRRLADSGFNDRRAECAEAVEILRRRGLDVEALRDVDRDAYERFSHHLPLPLRRRVLHVVEECERVHRGMEALRRGDLDAYHRLVRRSHLSSRDLYEVSIPEIDVLAAAAWGVEGCYGARLAGGGFGGCVNALVAPGACDDVVRAMTEAFAKAFGKEPRIFTTSVSDGAAVLRG